MKRMGDKRQQIKRPQKCTLALLQSGGCEKRGVKQYPGLGLLNNFSNSIVKVWAWELWLNRHETCSPPLLTASIRPNEAIIGGVGCCSLGKHGVSKTQRRWQQRLGTLLPKRVFLWTVCSAIASKARWQNIHQISIANIWKGLWTLLFVGFPFSSQWWLTLPPHDLTPTHVHTQAHTRQTLWILETTTW